MLLRCPGNVRDGAGRCVLPCERDKTMVNITLLGEQSVVDPVTERTLTLSARSVALLGLLI